MQSMQHPGDMQGHHGGGMQPMGGMPMHGEQDAQFGDPLMQVVAQLPLNWVQLRGPDGTFFVNSVTRQVTQDVPPALRQLAAEQQMQQQPQHHQQQHQQHHQPMPPMQQHHQQAPMHQMGMQAPMDPQQHMQQGMPGGQSAPPQQGGNVEVKGKIG